MNGSTLEFVPSAGAKVQRVFTTPGVNPYDEVAWSTRDITQSNWKTGEVVFEQLGVEFPEFWSANAATIVTTKYFRGALGAPEREVSLRDVIERVVKVYVRAGVENGYFASPEDADVFGDELRWMLLHQVFSFNSPVWFNVGTKAPQQVSACFILSVDDTMDSILNWYREEGLIFKGGSGAGVNLSKLRSSVELLSSGGTASGPVSFMRGADASAGTIKSGGATRRAAKMVVLDVDHPDIEEFIETKVREEAKIRALRDAGFDMDLGGRDSISVQYQNANNSVRVSDEFMRAVENKSTFDLLARSTGEPVRSVPADELMLSMASAAWECADPGIQYDGTINDWHTCPNSGRISASNPCSEYVHLDNSSCNLASLNLLKFLLPDGSFDVQRFQAAVELVITAMDISICFADFPTEAIGRTSRDFRQLGIGYANLGALLMSSGVAYDSAQGRSAAAAITSLMSGTAYRRSAELAGVVGPYAGYVSNAGPHTRVMRKHEEASAHLLAVTSGQVTDDTGMLCRSQMATPIAEAADEQWKLNLEIGSQLGWRNSQISVLAPTGTIGLAMDVDTTGVEPDLALVKFKKMVDGSSLQIINMSVPRALAKLGYNTAEVAAIEAYILEHGNVVDCDLVHPDHKSVFQCAMGVDPISAMGHVRMMAAVQPFLSGAISKTVNLPASATVEEIYDIYVQGWKLGLKALAVYRDGSKYGQPLSDAKAKEEFTPTEVGSPQRRRLPRTRSARTVSFTISGLEGYLTTGEYEDGTLGELFIKVSKQGSTLSGIMDGLAMAVSVGLQYGVPLETYVSKYLNSSFEPAGLTDDSEVRMAKSLLDFIFRKLALMYLPEEVRAAYGVHSTQERTALLDSKDKASDSAAPTSNPASRVEFRIEAPMCMTCGTNSHMRPSGSCWSCEGCGNTSGCS